MAMPYLFFMWGRGKYKLADILELEAKSNIGLKVWVFVLIRADVSPDVQHGNGEIESGVS